VAKVSAEELAALVPCPVEDVRRFDELGLLDCENGQFDTSQAHVVRLMAGFEAAGLSLEVVARAMASQALSFPLGRFLGEPAEMTETYEQLGRRLGRSPELLRRLSVEVGLPPQSSDRIRSEDAEMLELIVARLERADDDELSRFARLYGGTIQRLVGSGLQFFDRAVREHIDSLDLPLDERDRLIYQKAGGFTELVSRIVPWLQRRHREHAVIEYIVSATEDFMEEHGFIPPQPRQPPAIAFLDLAGYTALAEEQGDEAAAALAADLATLVQHAAQSHGGRPVKWLGDGVMFYFADPAGAIRSGLELIERTEQAILVPARIGINAGAVVVQEGDYFGRTVNVASRIADYARAREVLVSDEAKQTAGADDVDFELVGDLKLKGLSRAVRVHRAVRPPG
jgi:class 3 adenylate cyclase